MLIINMENLKQDFIEYGLTLKTDAITIML